MSGIGDVLRDARKAAGLTQRALAAELGIGQAFVHQIESGARPLPQPLIAKLPAQIRRRVIRAMIAELRTML